jgi:predicted RNase H-like HicB family nuclease
VELDEVRSRRDVQRPQEGLTVKLRVLLHPAEEGGYWVEVPALPGCVSEGDTFEEALANIGEAAEGWLVVADGAALES